MELNNGQKAKVESLEIVKQAFLEVMDLYVKQLTGELDGEEIRQRIEASGEEHDVLFILAANEAAQFIPRVANKVTVMGFIRGLLDDRRIAKSN